jgi:hypothetical protein
MATAASSATSLILSSSPQSLFAIAFESLILRAISSEKLHPSHWINLGGLNGNAEQGIVTVVGIDFLTIIFLFIVQ